MIDPDAESIDEVDSVTVRMQFDCGSVYSIIDDLNGQPLRVFLKKGHTGLCVQALLEAIGRLLTIIVQRTDVDLVHVWKTLVGITCESGSPLVDGASCMDGFARKLKELYPHRFESTPAPVELDEEELCAPTD